MSKAAAEGRAITFYDKAVKHEFPSRLILPVRTVLEALFRGNCHLRQVARWGPPSQGPEVGLASFRRFVIGCDCPSQHPCSQRLRRRTLGSYV
jgi:hypothetical protein